MTDHDNHSLMAALWADLNVSNLSRWAVHCKPSFLMGSLVISACGLLTCMLACQLNIRDFKEAVIGTFGIKGLARVIFTDKSQLKGAYCGR